MTIASDGECFTHDETSLAAPVRRIISLSLTGMAPNNVRALAPALPDKLTDQEYWTLVSELSEPDGEFRSDNLLSNELYLQYVIPELLRTAKPNRVYLGVGPEQNFTYIAALKPRMVFIVDIRRGNLQLQLMYKALFEMSDDRADFIFRLFSRKRPDGIGAKSTADEIFTAVHKAAPDKREVGELLFRQNLKLIQDHLTRTRHLPLTQEDLKGIEYVYGQFSWHGPGLSYWSSGRGGGREAPTYWDLMVAEDGKGQTRSFLASEENFQVLKALHEKNLLVPVVGNFSGPKAVQGRRSLSQGARRCRVGLLSLERRAVLATRRHVAQLLRKRINPAARRVEHIHQIGPKQHVRARRRARFGDGEHSGRYEAVRQRA